MNRQTLPGHEADGVIDVRAFEEYWEQARRGQRFSALAVVVVALTGCVLLFAYGERFAALCVFLGASAIEIFMALKWMSFQKHVNRALMSTLYSGGLQEFPQRSGSQRDSS